MIKIKIIPDFKRDTAIAEEIIENSREKWGDGAGFLEPLLAKGRLIGLALKDNSIVGFSLATRITAGRSIAIAFLATRVLSEFRNKGIAKTLVRRMTRYYIVKNRLLNPLNWFRPAYFVTATANPIVFENFRRYLGLNSPRPSNIELDIAVRFAEIFASREKFNQKSLVLSGAFLNSAEFYDKAEDIPWSNNEETNAFLEERVKLKEKTGNGLIVIRKIL